MPTINSYIIKPWTTYLLGSEAFLYSSKCQLRAAITKFMDSFQVLQNKQLSWS